MLLSSAAGGTAALAALILLASCGEHIVVGVNRFQMEEENPIPTFRLDPALERSQIERLRQLKASRNQTEVVESLNRLEQAARSDANLLPKILDAANAYATVGEISDRLRTVFGEYHERP